jgi:TldD protein
MEVDPFTVALGDKAEALLSGTRAAVADTAHKMKCEGDLFFTRHDKTFGSTEGSATDQTLYRSLPLLSVTAIDPARGEFETVDTDGFLPPAQIGYECVTRGDLPGLGRRAAEIAVSRLGAVPVEPGRYDLVIAPSNLWLTIHESVGHPTELDRALGYEANFAGTSFATPAQIGHLRYGSELVNIVADRTQKGALATCAWDDDGVAADRWDLVRKGLLVGFQTTREQAPWIHEAHGHASSYAQSWSAVPFQRMPNVSLQPGDKRLAPEELVADTRRGLFLEGRGSWSIDQQRYNFQFSAQRATLIEGGKLVRPVRYCAYQSSSVDFWRACDAVCDARDYRLGGSLFDGKGEPIQANAVSHGCSTARFRGVNILNSRSRS